MRRTLLLVPVLAAITLSACSSSPSPSSTSTTHAPTAVIAPSVANATNLSVEPVISAGTGAPSSQLTFKDLVVGTGTQAYASSTVTINYVGALYSDGHVFDDSPWTSKKPAGPYPLSTFITGFRDGITGMKVGGRREIVIPPRLAYGAQGVPQAAIPPNATLVFVVDLLKIG
jgi:peptidylprolyl isomerase